MFTKTKLAVAATLILGSASMALAEGVSFDETRAPAAVQAQTLTTRPVALPRTQAPAASDDEYINRASQVFDGGAG
jgi:hypothetical protein